MEGSVGVSETNCDSDKHVKCPKCCTTGEKHVPQPTIDEKHKQKNQEILERKRKLSNAGWKQSRKVSEPESHQLAAKFAFERQQQKKVEVFDSHAIDFTQHKDTDNQADIFLPRHLKKRQSTQSLNLNKVKEENNAGDRQASQTTAAADVENEKQTIVDGEDGLAELRNVEDLRRASLTHGILGPQRRNSPQHDTLRAYFKFRKDNMAKEDRLKRIQSKARLRDSEDEPASSPNIIRKPTGSRTILPPLNKFNSQSKVKTTTDAVELNRAINNERSNKEPHGKLPKISRKKNKVREEGREGRKRDPRFQKLISCLVPLSEKSGMSPPFSRKRHYTT